MPSNMLFLYRCSICNLDIKFISKYTVVIFVFSVFYQYLFYLWTRIPSQHLVSITVSYEWLSPVHPTSFPQITALHKCTGSCQRKAPPSSPMASSPPHPSMCVWWTEYSTTSPTMISVMAEWWRQWSLKETWMLREGKTVEGKRAPHSHLPLAQCTHRRYGGGIILVSICSALCVQLRVPFP